FLHGTMLLDKQIFGPCMQSLSHAADLAEKLGDNFMLGQIYTNLHLLCSDVYNADATEYARKALEAYRKHGNPLYVMDGEVNLAIAHYNNREYAASELLLDSALVRANALGDDFVALKCIRYKMYIQVGRQEWSHAISSYQTLKNTYGKRVCMEDYAHIAIAYAALQQRDSAEFYLNRARKDNYKVVNNELLYLNSAHRVYKFLKVYEQFAEYGQIYQIKRDSIYWTRLKNSVMREQYVTVQQKLNDSESMVDVLLWVVGSLLLCLVPLVSILYVLNIKRKAEREALRHLEEEKKLRNENYEKSVLILKQSNVVSDLRRYILNLELVPQSKWNELDLLFAETLPDFEVRLKQDGAVSESVWRISQLVKLDFTIDEIALLMNKAASSISSICNRTAKKSLGENSGAKEWREYVSNL
ncbi:MAG: hypothetical protein MJZ34_16700, partial [Paludibacteraceae bacterium]|nr:hypothetical protein [Paludibacteraceae bacterium]